MMYMKLKDGKSKVLTLSYDDSCVEDIKFVEILDKYGLKCTFNTNSGVYCPEDRVREKFAGRMKLSEAKKLYINSGHEVAVHTYSHCFLEKLNAQQIIKEVTEDKKQIEKNYGIIARGMAYPYGTYNDEVIDLLEKCGICYSRTTISTKGFALPDNWLKFNPTCHHKEPTLMEIAKRFVEENPRYNVQNWMFCLWGHSYEFNSDEEWEKIEKFAEYTGNRDDIWYATNIEIFDYVKAYQSLQVSSDETIIHNPSATDVWFAREITLGYNDVEMLCVHGGETLYL